MGDVTVKLALVTELGRKFASTAMALRVQLEPIWKGAV